jgi:hypothetical protein
MKPDELLHDLGSLARAQAKQDAVGEDADELLRPLDAAAHERIVARLLPLVQPEPQPIVNPGGQPRGVRGSRQPRSRRWIMAPAALAIAAALLLLVWASPGGRPVHAPQVADADAPLPAYALEVRGGSSAERGASTDAPLRVAAGDRVSAVLRPAMAVNGTVAVRVFIEGRALEAPGLVIEQSADGAVRISDLGPALAALPPGRHRLQFAVGRPEHLASALTNELPLTGAHADRVQLLNYVVERVPQ